MVLQAVEANIRIRPTEPREAANIDDLAALCGLSVRAAHELKKAETIAFSAVDAGALVGFALGRLVADELEILDVAVAPSARRQGVAKALVGELLQKGTAAGARQAFLEVRKENATAVGMYRGLEFENVGQRERYYADGSDALLMRVELCRTEGER